MSQLYKKEIASALFKIRDDITGYIIRRPNKLALAE